MARPSKREQLIEAALDLFLTKGFHAVGVDAIAEHAGITKKTLYHHFRSKDELILAALRYRDERFRNAFMQAVEARTKDPVARLLALFDVAGDWFQETDFFGCIFVGAMREYPVPDTPLQHLCRESKEMVRRYIQGLAEKAGMDEPEILAGQLLLLLEGAITMALINKSPEIAVQAREAARTLIRRTPTPS